MHSAVRELSRTVTPPDILPAATAQHADLRTLLEYWQRVRGPDAMPAQVQIARDIAGLLKRIHLSDVVDAGADFRFRLLGDAVFQCLDENQTGKLVSVHPDISVRTRYPILMREVVRTAAPVRGRALRETNSGRFHVESIWLPFGGPEVAQVMGMSVLTADDPATDPARRH